MDSAGHVVVKDIIAKARKRTVDGISSHHTGAGMGPGARTIESTGASYGGDSLIKFSPRLRLEPYATYWAGSGRHLASLDSFSYTHSRWRPGWGATPPLPRA